MTITFLKTEEDQSANMNKTFSSNINVISAKNINSGENVTVVTNKTRWEKFPNIFPENVIIKEPETESSFE